MSHYSITNVSKKVLTTAFDFSEEDAKLVHKYRTKLTVLTDNTDQDGICVDMRTLHKQLQVKTNFRDWSKRRLKGFIENEDQRPFLSVGKSGGKPERNHLLTVDTAKQIAMMENTDLGRTVRKYFILCEKLVLKIAHRDPMRTNCKESTKLLTKNLGGRVNHKDLTRLIIELNGVICEIATGARPNAWRRNLKVDNVRDFLKENATVKELGRYDDVNKMAAVLTGNKDLNKKSIVDLIKGSFGESDIYMKYLTSSGWSKFE